MNKSGTRDLSPDSIPKPVKSHHYYIVVNDLLDDFPGKCSAGWMVMSEFLRSAPGYFRPAKNRQNPVDLQPYQGIFKAALFAYRLHLPKTTCWYWSMQAEKMGYIKRIVEREYTLYALTDKALPVGLRNESGTRHGTPSGTPSGTPDRSVVYSSIHSIEDDVRAVKLSVKDKNECVENLKRIKRDYGISAPCVDLRRRMGIDQEASYWFISGVCQVADRDCLNKQGQCVELLTEIFERLQGKTIRSPQGLAYKTFVNWRG